MPRLSGHITVIAIGKLRQSFWKLAQKDYQKRLEYYTDFTIIEIKDKVGTGLPDDVALKKEGELLLKAAESANRKIALTPIGIQMSSIQLATYIQRQIQLYGHLAFLIGGPLGFSDNVLTECHEQISLSSLTFPHEMARIIFLEQLYRVATIINEENYHK